MDKTVAFVEFLTDWQNISYEQVESASEIKIFNIIGTTLQLVKMEYMYVDDVFNFFNTLNITSEELEKLENIIGNAIESTIIIN